MWIVIALNSDNSYITLFHFHLGCSNKYRHTSNPLKVMLTRLVCLAGTMSCPSNVRGVNRTLNLYQPLSFSLFVPTDLDQFPFLRFTSSTYEHYLTQDSIPGFYRALYLFLSHRFVFAAIYTLEMFLKIIGRGFALHKYAYLRNAWNWLDFLVVVLG